MRVNFPDAPHNPLNVSPEQGKMLVMKEAALEGGLALTATVSREEVLRLLVGNPDQMRCDFCSTRPCLSLFPAETFELGGAEVLGLEGNRSIGGFAACGPCREFVRVRDREGLLRRSIKLLVQQPGGEEALAIGGALVFRAAIKMTHDGFFEHWRGEEVVLDEAGV